VLNTGDLLFATESKTQWHFFSLTAMAQDGKFRKPLSTKASSREKLPLKATADRRGWQGKSPVCSFPMAIQASDRLSLQVPFRIGTNALPLQPV
jgi:hypothetical protein